MRLNWCAYNYRAFDGYGRYSGYMIRALLRAGVEVSPLFAGHCDMPNWMLDRTETCFNGLAISCLPPYYLRRVPGMGAPGVSHSRHWLLTMTEGSSLPNGWAEIINRSGVERVIVPCQHNAEAFRSGGVEAPIHVIPGGTCPDEFPLRCKERAEGKPYTFLALADRGSRKGWSEVYAAFYQAFGGKTTGDQDVRLIIKCRPNGNGIVDMMRQAQDPDPRIVYQVEDAPNPAEVYAQADCAALPSRSEGWGMPHRECAMMGIPVITQRYSGMDDGDTEQWAIVVGTGRMERIPDDKSGHIKGEWRRVDVDALAGAMHNCYEHPQLAAEKGQRSAAWLRANQTWDHSASLLVDLMKEHDVWH